MPLVSMPGEKNSSKLPSCAAAGADQPVSKSAATHNGTAPPDLIGVANTFRTFSIMTPPKVGTRIPRQQKHGHGT